MVKNKKQKRKEMWDSISKTLLMAGFMIIGFALVRVPILLGIYLIAMSVLFHKANKDKKD